MNDSIAISLSNSIKAEAKNLGFISCGIAKAEFLEEDAPRLEKWLKEGKHGEMKYMENHFDKRLDPRLLVDGARSVISLLYNYYTDISQADKSAPILSKYAYGEDYHFVVKEKLSQLFNFIAEKTGGISGRTFVDSAPVLERSWALKSGLGWIGKNGNLINPKVGSFFFLCEIIIDVELSYDKPFLSDHCGTCTRCIDNCPTEAILPDKNIDGSRCISYLTIELKSQIPDEFKGKMENRFFGCDICQDVCPWNRFSIPHSEPSFSPPEEVINWTGKEWMEMNEELFKEIFKKSPLKRAGYNGIKRNIVFINNND